MTPSRRQFLIGAAAFATKTSLDLILPSETHGQESSLDDYRTEMFGTEFFGIHKKGLVDYLTPEFYQKDSQRFNEILLKTFQFFEQQPLYEKNQAQDQWTQDKDKTISQLVKNLSLEGLSLFASMQTSESIRQKIKQQGDFNFEKNITNYLKTKEQVDEKIKAIETLLPQAVGKNETELKLSLAMHNCYSEGLKRQITLEQETMFWLRWHHPNYLQEPVDLEKTKEQYQHALDKLKELKASFARNDVNATVNNFVDYRMRFEKANQLFQNNINTLLKQAETEIAQNMLGQPLVKIEYQGKLYLATKEFAQDWENVQNLINKKATEKLPDQSTPPLEKNVIKLFQDYYNYGRRDYRSFRNLYCNITQLPGLQKEFGSPEEYEKQIQKTFDQLKKELRFFSVRVQRVNSLSLQRLDQLQPLVPQNPIFAYECFSKIKGDIDTVTHYYLILQKQELKLLSYTSREDLRKRK